MKINKVIKCITMATVTTMLFINTSLATHLEYENINNTTILSLSVKAKTIEVPVAPNHKSLVVKYIYPNKEVVEKQINFNEEKTGDFYWDNNKLYIPKPKSEARVEVTSGNQDVEAFYFKNNLVTKIEDKKELEEARSEDKKQAVKKEPKEEPKKELKQIINYPMSKTVQLDKEIIKVQTSEGALTDVYVNEVLIKSKVDSKLAGIGLSIPLSKGLNNVKIVTYGEGQEKTFKTVIFYQVKEDKTNISNLGTAPISNIDINGTNLDKELQELQNMTPEELEERLNKIKEGQEDLDSEDNIIEVNTDVYFVFNQDYDGLETTDKNVIIYGKAINAQELYANNNFIDLDKNNNFKFIFELDEGNNLLILKGVNEGKETEETIRIKKLESNKFFKPNDNNTRKEPKKEDEIIVYDNEEDEDTDLMLKEIYEKNKKDQKKYLVITLISLAIGGVLFFISVKNDKEDKTDDLGDEDKNEYLDEEDDQYNEYKDDDEDI